MSKPQKIAVSLLLVLLAACMDSPGPEFNPGQEPLRLSDWNLFELKGGALVPNPASLRVEPLNTLFSDYAHKLRTVSIPAGKQVGWTADGLDFPVGTILSKTFYYPRNDAGGLILSEHQGALDSISLDYHRILETRLLVRRPEGWDALPYVWNEEQNEAFLRIAGATLAVHPADGEAAAGFDYFVPNQNQCGGCHVRKHPDGGLEPLGIVASQLNDPLPGHESGASVLELMSRRGWLELGELPDGIVSWRDTGAPLAARAAAYLDMNCGHCHNPEGPADTSGLLLDGFDRSPRQMGLCKPPVAAGGGAGTARFGIVPGQPDDSILVYRMESVAPDEMMPELGRSLVHAEGVALVREWIASLPGRCD